MSRKREDDAGITRARWRRIEQLLPAALDLPPDARAAFLDGQCGADGVLRAELDALLTAHERSGILDGRLTHPAAPGDTRLATGAIIAHYEIVEALGSGGMGVVYRARDLRLERTVALKFLSPGPADDPEAKRRFLTEARAAAALDHANVCAIHEIGETEDGRLFIAMAFVEGESLRSAITRGPLDVRRSVAIARAIAAALECAHEHGVVHRDVKPANVVLGADGSVKLVDFGIAKLADTTQTRGGATPGTVAYMSPEQVRGAAVDHRTDLWSLGVVLHEMLAGRRPFDGDTDAAILHAITSRAPARLRALRPDTPPALERIVARALSKDPDRRFPSARALSDALADAVHAVDRRRTPRARLFAVSTLLLAAGTAAGFAGWRAYTTRFALASVPRIEQLAAEGSYVEAYALAARAEQRLAADTTLARLMPVIADRITVTSEPDGALVWMRRVTGDGSLSADSTLAGVTPIRDRRVARADYHLVLRRDGYHAAERIASSALNRAEASLGVPVDVHIDVSLRPSSEPDGMVFVPGSEYTPVAREAPTQATVALHDFHIDTHEVTNAQFREFVVAGGYADPRWWRHTFVLDGRELSRQAAMRLLVDRTGLPGPRGWSSQEFPPDEAEHPVTGVTWYEAAAYAEFAGKRLPTIFEWEKAARDGRYTHFEQIVMPWGLADPARGIARRANFGSSGPEPVGSHPAGISPWGAHDMAGNVEEWLANPSGDERFVAGGAWDDPMYVFANYLSVSAFHASPSLGFRTAKGAGPGAAGGFEIPPGDVTPVYRPVADATYRALLQFYSYDRGPLDAQVVERVTTADWTRETVEIAGPWSDATRLYLYLPARGRPPYQTIVFIPGTNTFFEATPAGETERIMGAHVKAGRAVLAVHFKGTRGRAWDPGRTAPATSSVQYRQELVTHAAELRRSIDYLFTRPDVDTARLGYVGFSRGSGSWLPFAAVEPRFRSIVLIGGGIDERMRPVLPEADAVNFAPRIRAPVLLLNGRFDEEHPWNRRALPLWQLLSEPKRLEIVDGGHMPSPEARVPVINAWLDETLGQVR